VGIVLLKFFFAQINQQINQQKLYKKKVEKTELVEWRAIPST
jgi:hypothetical protein